MRIGQSATYRRRFAAADLERYRKLAGHAPVDATIPEPMINALFSYLLGVRLPGPGTNYLKQSCRFDRAATLGEELIARVEITRIRSEQRLLDLRTTCHAADGRLLAEGRALVLFRELDPATRID